MITNKKLDKYFWITSLVFITYLFIGSFVVSKDWLDLGYLVVLYIFIGIVNLSNKNK